MATMFSNVLVPFVMVSFGNGNLLIVPEDIEAVVGSTARFSCRTSARYGVNWDHTPVGSKSRQEVYFSESIIRPYDERFEVELDANTGDYNLTIRSVDWKDSGRYECIDMAGTGERHGAEFIVLAQPPTCQSDVSLEDLIGDNDCGLEQSIIQFHCNLRYSGNIAPRITWSASDGIKIVPKTLTIEKDSDRITFTTVFSAQWNMNGLRYICRTALSGHRWTSDTANVSYVFNTSEFKTVKAAGIHHCEANSSQLCKYRWMKATVDSQHMVADGQSLNAIDVGLYKCNAGCKMRERFCTVQPMSVNHVEESNTRDSSTEQFPLWAAIVISVVVSFLLFLGVFVAVKWRKKRQMKRTRGPVVTCRKVLETGDFLVQGMAVLGDRLYVIRSGISTMLIYQSSGNYNFIKEIQNTEVHDPRDIAACSLNDCLYITDYFQLCVWRMDRNESIQLWLENITKPLTLSVSCKGQVVMGQMPNKVSIYNADASISHSFEVYATEGLFTVIARQRLRHLSESTGKIQELEHVVDLGDGNYIISHGENTDACHEVVTVTNKGEIKRIYGHDKGNGNTQLHHPRHLAISGDVVFVADKANDRVVILDKHLQKLDEIGTEYNIKQPNSLCYSYGQLLIGQYRAIQILDMTKPPRLKRLLKGSCSSVEGEKEVLLEEPKM